MDDAGVFADASALIYLAKADGFAEGHAIFGALLVTPAVWREAVEVGESKGHGEVSRIRLAAENGLLKQFALSEESTRRAQDLSRRSRLGLGECQIFASARQGQDVLIDDVRARPTAISLQLWPIPTVMVPYVGVRRGIIRPAEALALLHRLARVSAVRGDVLGGIERSIKEME